MQKVCKNHKDSYLYTLGMGKSKTTRIEMPQDCYLSISAVSKGVYKENGSKFISYAHPCSCPEEAMKIVADYKKEYHDATHHCYAYRLGLKGDTFRLNDDGEPSSTAGRPIYGEILSKNLSDVIIVVIRYFGGIKLGVPGLIRAYKTAASAALDEAATVVKTAVCPIEATFPYENTDKVLKELRKAEAQIFEKNFGAAECSLKANVKISDTERIISILNKITTICRKRV